MHHSLLFSFPACLSIHAMYVACLLMPCILPVYPSHASTCLPMPCILPVYPCHASYLFTHAMHLTCLPIHAMYVACLHMPCTLPVYMPCTLPVYTCHVRCLFTMHLTCLPMQSMLPVYPCSVAFLFIQMMHPACYLAFQPCNAQEKSFWYSWLKVNLVYTQRLMISKYSRCTNAQFSRYQLIIQMHYTQMPKCPCIPNCQILKCPVANYSNVTHIHISQLLEHASEHPYFQQCAC